jgi:4-hydroxybenzoate polyprenyltransferase
MPLTDLRLAAIFITVLMTQLSISVLNEWADRDRDAAAQRARPVAIGRIAPSVALGLAIVFAIGVVPGAVSFGPTAAIVLLVGLAAGWAYDLWLKPTPWSFVPFAIAFPLLPVWVGLIAGRSPGSFAWLAAGGAFLAVAIHLADSLPDIRSDSAAGLRTLSVVLGVDHSMAAIAAGMMIGLLFVLFSLQFQPILGLAVSGAAVVAAIAVFLRGRQHPESVRWVVGTFAVLAALILITHLPRG